ncbi:hypothetical protein L226DRAFT_260046 [Lentinus tigrinus ALCF2SS1-7]|uniref:Chitinase n=1 Tax=Lentinus tigrinus ALCF2SS1-6 TaxID=1328759 RepID=A0A5C2RVR5_9APHY|nr:hypothetical protein L227DRAFT_346136 [Lentinus tigrinus ALCF2SS1-6]RPD70012.1 hypothetical protein L226DRAFT_260046 [Lentinus tigrinus ALCF2SS1-7]
MLSSPRQAFTHAYTQDDSINAIPLAFVNFRDNWAKSTSTNPNVKIYIGAPTSDTAGGSYIDLATLSSIALGARSQYSSFGGVMLWDASQAYGSSSDSQSTSHCTGLLLTRTTHHSQRTL